MSLCSLPFVSSSFKTELCKFIGAMYFFKYIDRLLLFFSSVGICMLLSVLEEQAMDSLLLGPDKQNDFMQSILHTMEKEAAGN